MPRRPDDSKEENVTVSIRFPKALKGEADAEAEADDRTLNSLVVRAVRVYLESKKTEKKGGKTHA